MRKSKISKWKQDKVVNHFLAGTTARCAASIVGINKPEFIVNVQIKI